MNNTQLGRVPLKLDSPPASYSTSQKVRSAISLACSHFNPRGLEALWRGPWTHTLTDLAAPYNGDIILLDQFPLFLSSVILEEQRLRREYAAIGMVYEDSSGDVLLDDLNEDFGATVEDVDSDLESSESDDMDGQFSDYSGEESNAPSESSAVPRLSTRLNTKKKLKEAQRVAEKADRIASLEARKKKLVELQETYAAHTRQASLTSGLNPDLSAATISPLGDSEAADWAPDFVLGHVPTYQLPESEKATRHFIRRAGVKTYHFCCPIIAEIKTQITTDLVHNKLLKAAKEDLMEYCAAYFLAFKVAKNVIALAASGTEWSWAAIDRNDVPKYDWTTKTLLNPRDPKVKQFYSKFTKYTLHLGTVRSDKELLTISQSYLYPMVRHVV